MPDGFLPGWRGQYSQAVCPPGVGWAAGQDAVTAVCGVLCETDGRGYVRPFVRVYMPSVSAFLPRRKRLIKRHVYKMHVGEVRAAAKLQGHRDQLFKLLGDE
jgi:hypothetical protein